MLDKLKYYSLLIVVTITTALAVVFRFKLLKNQAQKAQQQAQKLQLILQLEQKLKQRMQDTEDRHQQELETALNNPKRDHFSQKREID